MNTADPSEGPEEQGANARPMGFNSEGQDAFDARPPDTARREQPPWTAMLPNALMRLPDRWRGPRLWIIGSMLLLALLALVVRATLTRPATPQQTAPDTTTFFIGNRPTLVFAHEIGSVHISSGSDGQVSIRVSKNGITSAIAVHYSQHGDTIVATVDIESGLYLDTWVDFDVSVPRQAGLSLSVATGTLVVDDLGGDIALSNTNGSIWATNLSGSVALKTQSGSINTDNVSGQVKVTTQNGTITSTNTHLTGHSTMQAESGTINFHGSLDRSGSYQFGDTNGAVGLTLPRDAAYSVAARTTSGSINTDFPGVTVYHQGAGTVARGNVGDLPRARLLIQTTSGSIDLHQGG
jgi:hypothetical protein